MNKAKTIELVYEQIEAILIEELQEAYRMNMHSERDEGGFDLGLDGDLLKSLDTVLEYFMSPSEYRKWKESVTTPPKEDKFKDVIVKVGGLE